MELKDVILSTLAEMKDEPVKNSVESSVVQADKPLKQENKKQETTKEIDNKVDKEVTDSESSYENEISYLNSLRERLLVLFEGFQAPNNSNIEAKIDLTLNFLEYVLATIDNRIEKLQKGK